MEKRYQQQRRENPDGFTTMYEFVPEGEPREGFHILDPLQCENLLARNDSSERSPTH